MIPQQNNETPVGLAGLQKSGVAVPSQTRNMEYFFNLAKKMSDGQLADVLSGKSLNLPQFVAMTEAMGRKQLRQAMQGAQAQQQAQQPSVKDQLLAEEAGLAALPAPNMASLGEGHAAGGIIAFGNGGDVPRFNGDYESFIANQQKEDQESLKDTAKKLGLSLADVLMLAPRAGAGILNAGPIRSFRAAGADIPYIPDVAGGDFSSMTPLYDKYIREPNKKAPAPTTADTLAFTDNAGTNPPPATPTPAEKEAAAKAAKEAQQRRDYLTQGQGQDPYKRRASPFGAFNPEAVDYNKIKEQGLGEGLLRLAGGILSKPGAAGYGAGMAALGEQAGLTRKEIAGLQKDEREYKFNVAKANELFEQGQDEMAYKYLKQAQDNRYHMLMATKPGAGLEMLNALTDPAKMKIWQQMNALKKPTDTVSKEKALAQWKNVGPKERREKYGDDFNTYYNTINNQLLTDTIGDGVVLGKV